MGMTIGEASHVNTVLDALFAPGETSQEHYQRALVYLADRAYSTLHAGWDGKGVGRMSEADVDRLDAVTAMEAISSLLTRTSQWTDATWLLVARVVTRAGYEVEYQEQL